MNGRLVKWMSCGVLLCLTLTCQAVAVKPNVIVILCDDLGYGDVGGFGFEDSVTHTPHIDRLADQGVRLTRFLVPTPYCAPSRATLLTGRYPYHTGIVYNPTPDQGINDYGLAPEEVTVAEVLKAGGYRTACVGKWHLGHKPRFLPTQQGFDQYLGILYSNDMRPVQLVEDETVVDYPVVQAHLTRRYTEASIEFMREAVTARQPFFLYLAHAMPHKPLAASEDFYTPDTPDDLYEDVIRELDWSVGQIQKTLIELNIDKDTLLIFMSDNGASYGGDNGGLRGKKATSWDGGLRVPFIAKWPGRLPGGRVNASLAPSVDLLPTIVRAAGLSLPSDRVIDGKDLWPLLTSEQAPSQHEYVITMHNERLMTIQSGPWKLHVCAHKQYRAPKDLSSWKDRRGPDGVTIIAPYEQATPASYPGLTTGDESRAGSLFHMEDDPGEQKDVSAQYPEVVKRLRGHADTAQAEIPTLERPRPSHPFRHVKGGRFDFWRDPNVSR